MNQPALSILYLGEWDSTVAYYQVPLSNVIGLGNMTLLPAVTYQNVLYIGYNSNPTFGLIPTSDNAWVPQSLPFTPTNVLGTVLTGYTSTQGIVDQTKTILQSIEYLSSPSNGMISGISGTVPNTGAIPLITGSYAGTTDITFTSPFFTIPIGKTFLIRASFPTTSGLGDSCTFSFGGNVNFSPAASLFDVPSGTIASTVTLEARVTGTIAPATVQLNASNFVGTPGGITYTNAYIAIDQV